MSYFMDRARQLGINIPEPGQARPGESYFQQRARELGISPVSQVPASPVQSAPAASSQPSGFFQTRAMELGLIPDNRPAPTVATIPAPNMASKPQAVTPGQFLTQTNQSVQNWNLPAVAAANPSTRQPSAAEQQLAKNDADRAATGAPKWLQNAAGAVDRFFYENPVGQAAKRLGQSAAGVFGITPEDVGDTSVSTGNKVADKAIDIAGGFAGYATNPAQIESNLVSGTYGAARSALNTGVGQKVEHGLQNAASRLVNRFAPGISSKVTDRAVTGALKGGVANALQNVAIGAQAGQTEGKDVAWNALIGGALGGAADAGLGALGVGLRDALSRYRDRAVNPQTIDQILALPAPRERRSMNSVETPDVIRIQENGPRGLPEPSPERAAQARNVQAANVEISAIDDELKALESRYQQAVIDQYKYLKQSMGERGGVSQGGLLRDEAGDVVGRVGRSSNNPEWYQEFFRTNGRTPTNRDLYQLAKQHVDEGFTDGGQAIPSWKAQNDYDSTVQALQQVKSRLNRTVNPDAKEPTDLSELLKSRGFADETPENIAKVYNDKNWYHGTGKADLTAEDLDPLIGSHESLFGQGVYLTDSPTIAEGYAKSRGKRSKTPTVYESNVNVNRVLDLEKPITRDVADALDRTVKPLDYQYNQEFDDPDHFTKLIRSEAGKPDATPEQVITALREAVRDFSHEAGIPTSEFVDTFQDLAANLKQAGYDGLTHTGGLRTGKDPHRVLILLDPQNVSGSAEGARAVSRFEKFTPKPKEAYFPAAAPQSVPARAPGVKPIPKEPVATRSLSPFKQEPEAPVAPERPNREFTPSKPAGGPDPLRITPFGKREKFTDPSDTRTYIVTKTDREPIDLAGAADEFYRKTVDNLQDINRFDKYVEQQTGTPLPAEDRAYYQALNSRGSDMIAKYILTERLVDAQGNPIGESLKNITQQIPKGTYKNFTDYLIARHAETRIARGEKVYDKRTGMNDVGNIARKIEQYEATYPKFKELAKQIYDWNDKLGQAWLVDTGIIPQEMWDAWKRENPYWVPNKRQFTKLEKTGKAQGAKRGFASQSNPVKKYSPGGSERPIIDPIESMIEYVDRYVKTAKRNEVMQTIVRNLEKDPEGLESFAELIPKEDYANYQSIKQMNSTIENDGIDTLLDQLDQELDIKYNKDQFQRSGNKDNVVTALIGGEKVPVKINDIHLLDALTNLSPQAQNIVIETARKATNAMKLLTTGINPVFSLTRNIFRDIPQAYIFSKTTNNPFRFAWDMLDGVVSTFGNRELYQRYKAVGGGHSSSVAADRNLLKQSKSEILPQHRRGTGLLPRIYHAAENLSNVIESAPRLGEFKRVTQAGGDTYESRIKGLFEANDITTNFKRKGQVTKDADAFLPYINAAVQGLDKFARAFRDNPGAVAGKAAMAISIPSIALFALNYNNENYKKLSNYTKDNFFLIPLTNGQFFKIPKPRELGIPFGALLERTMRAWLQKDPESFRDFADSVSTAFAPPGVPAKELATGDFMGAAIAPVRDTILGPVVDIAANKTFTGAPVVPEYLSNVSPRYQYDANTSEVSKKIGDILNVSPKQLDHLIQSYTGVVGQIGIPAATQGGGGILGRIGQTLTKQVTADPAFSTDATSYFYDMKDKMDRQSADIKLTGKVPAGYNDSLRKYVNKVADQISDVTKAIRAVDDLDLSSKQKADKKRELTELRNNLATQAYQTVQQQK